MRAGCVRGACGVRAECVRVRAFLVLFSCVVRAWLVRGTCMRAWLMHVTRESTRDAGCVRGACGVRAKCVRSARVRACVWACGVRACVPRACVPRTHA